MKKKGLYIFAFLIMCLSFSIAQTKRIDSLLTAHKLGKADTTNVNTLNMLCIELMKARDFTKTDSFAKVSLPLAEKLNFKRGLADVYSALGFTHYELSNYMEALDHNKKALALYQELNNDKAASRVLNNIGLIYSEQGDFGKALENSFKALSISEKTQNKDALAANLGNIGNIYNYQGDRIKALEYYFRSVEMFRAMGKNSVNAGNFHNIANIYTSQAQNKLSSGNNLEANELFSKAISYYDEAISINEKNNNKTWLANNMVGVGIIHETLSENEAALESYLRGLKLSEEIGNKHAIITAHSQLGGLYLRQMNLPESESHYRSALVIAKNIGVLQLQQNINFKLSRLFAKKGDDKSAVLFYRESVVCKDSVFNQSKRKEMTKAEMNYEFEKKEAALKAEQDKKDAVTATEKKKQKIVLVLICSMLFLVFLFSGLIYRSLKITKKQQKLIELKNKETEVQKSIIEEKNKDILDSIKYARRIQLSLMPTERYISRILKIDTSPSNPSP